MRVRRAIIAMCALGAVAGARAQACNEPGWRTQRIDAIAQGGRLYDNWWAACGLAEPQGTHPSYPAAGKQSGAVTWRCKECHGWDYRGKDGAYAEGAHYTGIGGIAAAAGRSEAGIVATLKDSTHRFDGVMPQALLQRVARFVARGQVDAGAYIDPRTKAVAGRVGAGRRIYAQQCMACHGAAGRALNFSASPGAPEYVGTVAADNPWEAWHKIRHGQPGAVMNAQRVSELAADPDAQKGPRGTMGGSMHGRMGEHMGGPMAGHMLAGRAMPAMRDRLSLRQQLDLLSFLQTLPPR
ncbi:MAG: cytochrome c [Burkholderiaceae bacterium]|nr:cytochrome c [Burkholderiaceae bacterium]